MKSLGPVGAIAGGIGGKILGGKGKKSGGRRRSKQLNPERLVKKLFQLRMKNKLLKEKMKPLSYIK